MIISVAWWNTPEDFEQNPLHCLASSIRGLVSEEKMVLLINDADKLCPDYKELCDFLGVEIVNVAGMKSRVANTYPQLALYSNFEANCFMRWLFIEEYLKKAAQPIKDVLIVDGDILFLIKPEYLINAFTGTTFVLQGCPALTFLSEPLEWLDKYVNNLSYFVQNIEPFSQQLWDNKESKASQVPEPGDFSRNPLASDQDLISALIINRLLPQDDITEIRKRNRIYMAENPLYMFHYYQQNSRRSFTFQKEPSGEITINGDCISHLHFQTSFTDYCCRALYSKPNLPIRVPNLYAESSQSFLRKGLNMLLRKYYTYTLQPVKRLYLYLSIEELSSLIIKGTETCNVPERLRDKYFPMKNLPAQYSLRDVFSPACWWQNEISINWP